MSNIIETTSHAFSSATVSDFGKVIFVPRNHTLPALPDMNLIVFNNNGTYQAICIDIEIDAVGGNLKEACNNLKKSLIIYIEQMIINHNNNTKVAIEDIVNTAFSDGKIKTILYERYKKTKHQYLLDMIAKNNKAKSRKTEIFNAWKRTFQSQPIQFRLTLAAGTV